MINVLAVVLAGGKGSRLEPLTRDRAKPAVPFGGAYRIIDFTLSNCLNSGLRKMLVLTQYKAMSLDRHINIGWRHFLCRELGEFIDVVPPQQRIDEHWYQGTADAVYQNIYTLEKERPEYVVDPGRRPHLQDGLLQAGRVPQEQPGRPDRGGLARGRVRVAAFRRDAGRRAISASWASRKSRPCREPIPGDPEHILASMGIYVFTARFLFEQLCLDATRPDSAHDFGKDIIPSIIDTHRVFAFPFRDENRKQDAYWRDVGTLDAYYAANMDLVSVDPLLNMYDEHWPIRTYHPNYPPPKFVFAEEGPHARRGEALDSIVCQGSHHLRRPGAAFDPRPQHPRQQLRPGRRLDPAGRRRHRPALPRSPGHHRQGRAHSRRHVDRLRPGAGSGPRLSRSAKGAWWSSPRPTASTISSSSK